jgi:hypothetical protein
MKKIIYLTILLTIASGFGMAVAQSTNSMSEKSGTKSEKSGTKMTDDKSGWKEIGKKKVSLKAGHDELAVNDPERFKAIKVEAKDEGLTLTDVHLFYKSGATQDISLNTAIAANGESKEIDLSGDSHNITKIEFKYKSPDGMTSMKDENATIVVMGLLASNDAPKKY